MRLSCRSGRHSSKIELSMTSMIDVVFLLLIFFMTTSSFVKTERELDTAIRVKRDAAGSAAKQDLQPAVVEVIKGKAGGIVFRLGGRELTSETELTKLLKQFDNKLDGAYVRASDEATYNQAAAAIQACKSAGFLQVTYQPYEASK